MSRRLSSLVAIAATILGGASLAGAQTVTYCTQFSFSPAFSPAGADAGSCGGLVSMMLGGGANRATLTFTGHDEWLGHRPAPSDSLPLIGEAPRHRGIFLAFGHHHIGLTTGAKTGRLLASLVNREQPEIDMAPYTPMRFAA